MRVQTGLQVGDVGPQPPHFIELPHVRIRASRVNSGRRTARYLEVLHRRRDPSGSQDVDWPIVQGKSDRLSARSSAETPEIGDAPTICKYPARRIRAIWEPLRHERRSRRACRSSTHRRRPDPRRGGHGTQCSRARAHPPRGRRAHHGARAVHAPPRRGRPRPRAALSAARAAQKLHGLRGRVDARLAARVGSARGDRRGAIRRPADGHGHRPAQRRRAGDLHHGVQRREGVGPPMAAARVPLRPAGAKRARDARAAVVHPLRAVDARQRAARAAPAPPAPVLREQLQRRLGGVHRRLLPHPHARHDAVLGQLVRLPHAAAHRPLQALHQAPRDRGQPLLQRLPRRHDDDRPLRARARREAARLPRAHEGHGSRGLRATPGAHFVTDVQGCL